MKELMAIGCWFDTLGFVTFNQLLLPPKHGNCNTNDNESGLNERISFFLVQLQV